MEVETGGSCCKQADYSSLGHKLWVQLRDPASVYKVEINQRRLLMLTSDPYMPVNAHGCTHMCTYT